MNEYLDSRLHQNPGPSHGQKGYMTVMQTNSSHPRGDAQTMPPMLSMRPTPEPSLAEHIRNAQAGDLEAFEMLYRTHVGRVYAVCLRMTSDANQAEELTQEAFVKAWQGLSSFQNGTNFSAWLSKVAVNGVLAHTRSTTRRTARESTHEELQAHAPSPQASAGLSMDLERAIATLSPGARDVFVLHDVEGYKHREIAEMMGITIGTTKGYLHRARTALRKVLGP